MSNPERRANSSTVGASAENRTIAVQALILVLLTLTNVVVARHWGAQARGELATATVLAGLAAYVGGLGLHDVVVWASGQEIPTDHWASWFRATMISSGCFGVVVAIIAYVVFRWNPWLAATAGAWTVVTHSLRVQDASLLATNRLRAFDLARLATYAVGLITLACLAALGSRLHPLYGVFLAQLAVALVLTRFAVALKMLGPAKFPSGRALRIGLLSSTGGLIQASLARTDVLIVALLLGAAQAGIYSIALAAAEAALVAASALSFHAVRAGAKQGPSRYLAWKAVATSLALCLGAFVVLHEFAASILGNAFAPVDITFLFVAPGVIALALLKIRWASSIGRGSAVVPALAMVVAVVLQTALDLILVPKHGINAAAAVSSFAYIIAAALSVLPFGSGTVGKVGASNGLSE